MLKQTSGTISWHIITIDNMVAFIVSGTYFSEIIILNSSTVNIS